LDRLAKEFVETGRPVAAGFISARLTGHVPADATPEQLEQLRTMFMAGAQHLWGMIFAVMDEDREPTDADMRRMSIIDSELEAWYAEQAKKYGLPPRNTKVQQ
jgi:hypothetical protein